MMKTTVKLFLLGALAVFAMSCTHKNLEERHVSVSPVFTGGVAENTKAVGNLWYGDKVGIMVIAADRSEMTEDYVNVGYQTDADGVTTAIFTVIDEADDIWYENSEESVTFVAYAPYYETDRTVLPGQDSDGIITGNTTSQPAYADQIYFDNLYAGEQVGSESEPEVHFNFFHKMVQLSVKITAGDGLTADDVQGATYTLGGIIQDGEFNLDQTSSAVGTCYTTGTTPLDDWELQGNWYKTTDGDDYDVCFTCIIYPQVPTTLPFFAHVDQADYTGTDFFETLDDGEFKAGCSYTYNVLINEHDLEVTGSTITDWNYYSYDYILGGPSEGDDEQNEEETVVYSNDFDAEVVSSNTNITSTTTCYKNETGSGIENVEYDWSSKTSVRKSNASDTYDGASGGNNIFFSTDDPGYFYIKNITLPDGETDYTLSFGARDDNETFVEGSFKVYISEDNESWVQLNYTFANGDLSKAWDVASVTFTVPEGTTTLSIYFEADLQSEFRIDDVSLVISEDAGTEIDFSTGVTVPEGSESTEVDTTGSGTEADPYTVADALAILNAGAEDSSANVCVSGIVSRIGEWNESYGELTYWISDDGSEEDELEIYNGLGLNSDKITSSDYLSVSDAVVVCGPLKNYSGTFEMTYTNYIVSITKASEEPDEPDDNTTTTINLSSDDDLASLTQTDGYYVIDSDCTITSDAAVSKRIHIISGADNVTFDNLKISLDEETDGGSQVAAVLISTDLTLTLSGTNEIDITYSSGSTEQYEAMMVNNNATLTIEGTDTDKLTFAEIGGDDDTNGNNKAALDLSGNASLIINGGNITAPGHYNYPGIGPGVGATCGDITINGGIVTATCRGLAAAIGSCSNATCGNITITGGTVSASCVSGNGVGIGTGTGGTCGVITISGGEITAVGTGAKNAAIGTGGQQTAATCGNIFITSGITSLTASNANSPESVIGRGNTSDSCGTVYLGGSTATDTSVTEWTPTGGQFTVTPATVYGWTYDEGTGKWTKN